MVAVGMHFLICDREFLSRIIKDDIRVHADRNRSFLTAAEYLRRIGGAQGHRPLKSEQPVDKLCQSFPVVEIRIVVDEVIRLDPLVHIIEAGRGQERGKAVFSSINDLLQKHHFYCML